MWDNLLANCFILAEGLMRQDCDDACPTMFIYSAPLYTSINIAVMDSKGCPNMRMATTRDRRRLHSLRTFEIIFLPSL